MHGEGGLSMGSSSLPSSVKYKSYVDPVVELRPIRPAVGSDESPVQSRSIKIRTVSDLKRAELSGERYDFNEAQWVKAIDAAIQKAAGRVTDLQFSIHGKTNTISVKIKDRETGEVIREIPPEKMLDFVAKLWEMAGILVDERR